MTREVDARDGPHGDHFGERDTARDQHRMYAMLWLLCYPGIMYDMIMEGRCILRVCKYDACLADIVRAKECTYV